jgi:hypothetical protein
MKNIDRMKWFLDFINLKIEDLADSDRLKWATEILYMLEFGEPHISLRNSPLTETEAWDEKISEWSAGKKLKRGQKIITDFLHEVFVNIEKVAEQKNEWIPLEEFEFGNNLFEFETTVKVIIQAPVDSGFKMKIENETEPNEQWFFRTDRKKLFQEPLYLSLISQNWEDSLKVVFLQSLEGLSNTFFRKCPECGKWFLHTTKKEKIYCTNKCATRKLSRDRRNKLKQDKEKYKDELKKGADRARRSYVKRVKRGRPARRPYKHTDSTEK